MQSVNQLSISRQQNYPSPNPPTWKVCDWWWQPFPGMFRPDTLHTVSPIPPTPPQPTYLKGLWLVTAVFSRYVQARHCTHSLPHSPHSTPTYLPERSVTGDSSLFQVCWGQTLYTQCAEARHCIHSLLISSASADNRTPLLQPTWKVCDWWQQSFPGVLRPGIVCTVCW